MRHYHFWIVQERQRIRKKHGQKVQNMINPEFDRKRIEKSLESTPGGERSKALFNGSGHL